jgi:hypothetical protein
VDQPAGRYCGACGAGLEDVENGDAELSRESLERIGIKSGRRWILVGSIVLLTLGGIGIYLGMSAAPSAPVPIAAAAPKARALRVGMPSVVRVEAVSTEAEEPVEIARAPSTRPRGREARAVATAPRAPATMETVGTTGEPAPAAEPQSPPRQLQLPPPTAYLESARAHVARAHHADVQRCFDAAGQPGSPASGAVRVGLVLDPGGRVLSSRVVSDSTGHPGIGGCITSAARGWTLPPPPDRTLEMFMSFRL